MDNGAWGKVIFFNLSGCNDNIKDRVMIRKFLKKLVKNINMKAYGRAQLNWFAGHDPSKAGYTAVQLIETSSITMHCVDATGEMYLDIFSCAEFNATQVVPILEEFFAPKKWDWGVIERFAPNPERNFKSWFIGNLGS